MVNSMRIIASVVMVLVISVITYSSCYARMTDREIKVDVNPTEEEAEKNKTIIPGKPYACYNLKTIRLQVKDRGEFLDISGISEEDLKIEAWCTIQDGDEARGVWYHDMLRFSSSTIECDEGQGIMVTAFKADDQEHNRYQYVAELTTFTRPSPEQWERIEARQKRKKALEAQSATKDKTKKDRAAKEKSKTKSNRVRIHTPLPIYMQPERSIQSNLGLSTAGLSSLINFNSK